MSRKKRVTTGQMLRNFAEWVDGQDASTKGYVQACVENILDEILAENPDAFGTEGQLDPRGDQRA